MQTFYFDRNFQIGVLALMMQSGEFLITATNLIRAEYFEDRVLVWVFQRIRDYYQDYGSKINKFVLLNEVKKSVLGGSIKDADITDYVDVISSLGQTVDAQQYVIAEVVRFCRRQEVRREMLELAPLTDSRDDSVWDQIETRMRTACNVGDFAVDIGTQYFLEYPERLRARALGEESLVIPTGIPDIDVLLNGGLKAGQLGIWMGGTGSGKSIALPQCGKRAVVSKHKVVHYTLELNEEEIAARYDASFGRVPVHELKTSFQEVDRRLGFMTSQFGNSLLIKEYPTGSATVGTLRQHLVSLKSYDFVPDLVLVDYGDLLKPSTNYNDAYADLGAIFKDLRGLAGELKVPLWTATQVNRAGMNQEVADVDSIGDSLQKAQIADVIIAICANREELEANILRLFIAKNRNGPPKRQVKIRSAYDRMCFYDPVGAPMPVPPANPKTTTAPSLPPPPRRQPKPQGRP